ncbi:hypothetical protein OAN24_05015, partial [Pseudodesulfovibrio sp.]|nr:hypothetical protein [Pseudodesulfovibrio sp.]
CISPSQDAFIELYASPGEDVPLGKLLDAWASAMTQRGLPFQNVVSEQPGQVSGYPAITRVYSGQISNGSQFNSSLVASRYNGTSYVFQGLSLKGQEQARQQVRQAMNTWHYPGVSHQTSSNSNGGLSLGSGSSVNTSQNGNSGGGLPTISGTFIADKKDYWGGKYYYRIYHYYGDGTFTDGQKNAATGEVKMGTRKRQYKISKSGKSYVVKSGRSCTDGFVTDTEGNEIRRFKSGCYTSGGNPMYFSRVIGNFVNTTNKVESNGLPTISGTFIADIKDYWAGKQYYRMYHFNGDGTFTDGQKNAATGQVKMNTRKQTYKISKSGNYYVVKSGKSCTDGYVTDTEGNGIRRFKSGCYSPGGRAMYFSRVK